MEGKDNSGSKVTIIPGVLNDRDGGKMEEEEEEKEDRRRGGGTSLKEMN